ncbi:helix-turn-helix domain-containing protein [Methylobacterium oxalidis]|uniref:HTH cro/C1-type domain-containing protein n=1 Tax=Methylobacterium oxalidis TaxID=944322 RepID=A0A512J932_9HYPH|nr:helix-turn-helix transcriptional regulator [Methylobacterium oxalidis]GEP06458.1 hypothetical protein MOX02_44960 [Methylobacterium oxalidis]GJE33518.1 hypothetical protein LDDCCGHA_3718 [Methylobacterium oxalidis]GLS65498.1 hypothetical protein GCM10007888_38800 [Methylobacterium oxalidis]
MAEPALLTRGAVGARIRHFRKRKGFRLSEVSAATGLCNSVLSRIERGHRPVTPEQCAVIAAYLGVPLASLEGPDLEVVTPEERDLLRTIRSLREDQRISLRRIVSTLAPSEARP